ncbi:hypothetical protein RMATCC62417_18615 [Rhizopus microsporus]|nr:hypothetical protein RMATCC62417_18615 [Rhizopus microsporus]
MDNNPFRNQQTPKDNSYMNSFLYQSQYPPSQQQQQQQQPNNSLYQNNNYNSNNHPAQQQFQPYQNTNTFPTTTITTTAMPTPQFSYDVGVSNTSTPAVTSMSPLYGHTGSLTSYSPQYPMMPTPTGYLFQQQQQQQQQMPYYQQYNTNAQQSSMSNMHIPPNFGLSTTTTTTSQTYQPRYPPIDASTLLKGTQIRRVECPVCQKMLEGDDMAINHHVNEHYN